MMCVTALLLCGSALTIEDAAAVENAVTSPNFETTDELLTSNVANLGFDLHIANNVRVGQNDKWFCLGGTIGDGSNSQQSIDTIRDIFSEVYCYKSFGTFVAEVEKKVRSIGIDKMLPANWNYIGMCHVLPVMRVCKLQKQEFSFDDNRIHQGSLRQIPLEQYNSIKQDISIYCRDLKLQEYLDEQMQRETPYEIDAAKMISYDIEQNDIKSLAKNIGHAMTRAIREKKTNVITNILGETPDKTLNPIVSKMQTGDNQISRNSPIYHALISSIFADISSINQKFNTNLTKDFPNYKDIQGFSGLRNFGVTCYFNSTMQALNALGSFRDAISDNLNPMSLYLNTLFGYLNKKNPAISASAFSSIIIGASMFNQITSQNDAHELLIKTIAAAVNGNPKLLNIFGTVTEQTSFIDQNREGHTLTQIVPIIPLQLGFEAQPKENKTLEGLISEYEAPAKLNDGSKDEVIIGQKENKINPGKLLIFQLGRFGSSAVIVNNKPAVRLWKNDRFVSYPEQLKIADKDYSLKSVINHFGNVGGGHYTATVKYQGKWYTANDSSIQETPFSAAKSAYVLLYEAM